MQITTFIFVEKKCRFVVTELVKLFDELDNSIFPGIIRKSTKDFKKLVNHHESFFVIPFQKSDFREKISHLVDARIRNSNSKLSFKYIMYLAKNEFDPLKPLIEKIIDENWYWTRVQFKYFSF